MKNHVSLTRLGSLTLSPPIRMGENLFHIPSKLFPVPLIVEALDDDIHWEAKKLFYSDDPVLGRIEMPAGTITDFGSIPQICQAIVSPTNRYRKPYVIHDRNYKLQKCSQHQADDCLLRGMKDRDEAHNKVCKWWQKKIGLERSIVYSQLRLWGWISWEQHRKENEKQLTPKK